MARRKCLIVDDEEGVRRAIRRVVSTLDVDPPQGLELLESHDAEGAIAVIQRQRPSIVLSDLRLPGASGFEILRVARQVIPASPFIFLTGAGTFADCARALREGAAEFIGKPFDSKALLDTMRALLEPGGAPVTPVGNAAFMGSSPAMLQALARVQAAASTDATVCLRGETGTGKDVVARLLHATSHRTGKPLVTLNCGAIPAELAESELFGHERGAFTGASERRVGRIVSANGGTLFLDEIGELTPALQVKLLRFLQDGEVQPVGSTTPTKADVRVIAATHRDLEEMVEAGTFREDLYYRLRVVTIELPPLRARKEDLPGLATQFLAEANARHKRAVELEPDAMPELLHHDWPGNVRELRHVIEGFVVLGLAHIDAHLVRDAVRGRPRPRRGDTPRPDDGRTLPEALAELERQMIVSALDKSGQNRQRAAEALGINRTTLVEKMRRLGLLVRGPGDGNA